MLWQIYLREQREESTIHSGVLLLIWLRQPDMSESSLPERPVQATLHTLCMARARSERRHWV